MNHSTPGLPVHHQLPEFTQTHVHRVGDAIQPSHPLSSLLLLPPVPPSIRVFSMSQLFSWGGQIIGVSASASVLPVNTQDWFPLGWTGWISLQSKGLSRVFPTPQFKSINYSMFSYKWCKWTYLQNRNRVTDVENKLMVTRGESREWGGIRRDWDRHVRNTMYNIGDY